MNQETQQFIADNLNKDIHQLALQSNRFPLVDMPLAIRQIAGKQKIRTKVSSFYDNEDILYPAQLSLEQSSSQKTAKYKSSLCEGESLVDLTGGFGIDCCFLSANFKQVTYIERQFELCELAKHNFKVLGLPHIQIIHTETEGYLPKMQPVDWIYIDPARRSSVGKKVVLLSDCEPNVATLSSLLLKKASKVMIKLSPMMDITAALKELPHTSEIHIVSVENECKEILLILESSENKNKQVYTINFGKNSQNQLFNFEAEAENNTNSNLATKLEKYLYEPNASIMKSGAFKLVGAEFSLFKLHLNTHLYTYNQLVDHFPGRIFEVIDTYGSSKTELKNLAIKCPKANITTRNYPISVDELRKKTKISDGGNVYIFACTLNGERKVLIECKKRE